MDPRRDARDARPRGARGWRGATCAALLLLAASSVRADAVSVSLDPERGACRVHGSFLAPVPADVAWRVLTDYPHIERFVHSVRRSGFEERDGHRLLRQEGTASVLLIPRRVTLLLEISESPNARIAFHDVLGKDFRRYAGEWTIAPTAEGTRVEYMLEAEPRAALGRVLCRGTMRRTAADLLAEVREEMIRRASEGPPAQ